MDDDEKDLITRYLNGDIKALEVLVKRFSPKLFGYIINMTRNREVAEDIYQETWKKALLNLSSFKKKNFSGWIMRIARNLVIDFYRQKKPNVSLDTEDDFNTSLRNSLQAPSKAPDEQVQTTELGNKIRLAISTLPREQRDVFLMRTEADLSFSEICKAQGVSINTALARMQYAVAKLRTALKYEYKQKEGPK